MNMLSLCGSSSSDGGPNGVQMANSASGGSSVLRFCPCSTLMRPRMSNRCAKMANKKKSILQNQVQARQGPSQRSIPNSFAYRFGMDTSGPVRTSQVNLEVNAQLCRIVLTCKYWIQYVGDCFPFDNGRRGRRERWNIGIYEVLFLCVSVLLKRVCMESFMCSFSRCHGAASKPTSQLFPTHHLGERHPSSLHSRLDPNFGATQSLETEKTTTTQQKKLGRKPGKTPNRNFFRR